MYPRESMPEAAHFKRPVVRTSTGERGFLMDWPDAAECSVIVAYAPDPRGAYAPTVAKWPKAEVQLDLETGR
jgi:hypothetical protein